MNFSLRLLLIFLAAPILAFSQSNYKPGIIVKANSDTINGFINYKDWGKTPKVIQFKSDLNGATIADYNPSSIKAFEVSGIEKYISYYGKISLDAIFFPDLPSALDTTTRTDSIFLQVINSGGKLQLYSHTDEIRNRLYISEGTSQPLELIYHHHYTANNQVEEVNRFRLQLHYLSSKVVPENTKVLSLIKSVPFNEDHISSIVNKINEKKSNTVKAKSTQFWVGLALNQSSLHFNGNELFPSNPKSISYGPKLNAAVEVFTHSTNQRLSLRTDLSLSYIQAKFHGKEMGFLNILYDETYQFKQYTLSFAPQIIYKYLNWQKLSAHIGVGISFNAFVYLDEKFTIQGSTTLLSPRLYTLDKSSVSIPFQTGVIFNKRLEIFAKYYPETSLTSYSDFEIVSSPKNIGINYSF